MAKIESPPDKTDTPEKPAKKPAPVPSKPAPRQTASPPGPVVAIGHKVLKLAGIVVGFPAAMICVMALIGGVTENGAMNRIRVVRIVKGEKKEIKVKLTDTVQPGDTIIIPERFF